MKEKMKKLRKNNKGFSLVELIIVIAIMAILVGVLAPQFIKYVEKSRKSNDVQTVDTICSAMEAAAVDPNVSLAAGDTITATCTTGGVTIACANSTSAVTEINDSIGTGAKMKSSDWGTFVITGTVGGNGNITFTTPCKKFTDYATDSKVVAAP